MHRRMSILILAVLFVMILGVGCETTIVEDGQMSVVDVPKETAEIFAMDTIIDLTVYGEHASDLLVKAKQMIGEYEALFSVNESDSDVAKLNRAGGAPVQVSEETYGLIRKSMEMTEETDGLFDISIYPLVRAWGFTTGQYRVPGQAELRNLIRLVDASRIQLNGTDTVQLEKGMEIDLGGIAKGYVSQKLTELFREGGAVAAVVSLGGNVQTYGEKPDGMLFTVGITDPDDGESILGTIQIGEKAVITSGSYQRYFEQDGTSYHHIIDVRTGAPAESDLKSVTVLAEDGTSADSLATALFVMGKEKAIAFAARHPEIQLILIDSRSEVWTSDGVEFQRTE